jgi:simple sugar transport system ATP-binding protein
MPDTELPPPADGGTAPLFAALGLWKHYGGVAAVRDVSLEFPAGTITAIVGDNGAGKSTLVKMLCGALHPDRGHLSLRGEEVRFATPAAAQAAGITTVYQDLALADHRNVAENLFLGRELVRSWGPLRWLARAEMRRATIAALGDLKIRIPDVRREARTLSGGQRQGVAIARAVHQGSIVLVMDEPMAALGLQEQDRVSGLIEHLAERGLTQLIVSHSLDHVFRLATHIAVMRLGALVAVRPTVQTDRSEILHLISGVDPHTGESAP